jgi:hypothetical protein
MRNKRNSVAIIIGCALSQIVSLTPEPIWMCAPAEASRLSSGQPNVSRSDIPSPKAQPLISTNSYLTLTLPLVRCQCQGNKEANTVGQHWRGSSMPQEHHKATPIDLSLRQLEIAIPEPFIKQR